MFSQAFAITRNTFFESIRQPIVFILIVVGTLLIVASGPLSAFTMDEDQRMLVDISLASVFLTGTLLSAFIATSVLGREIESGTVLTVVSKPINRPIFVIGKFLGVAGALIMTTLLLGLIFMLMEIYGTHQTVRHPVHEPIVIFGIGAAVIGILTAIWCNYFYGMVFTSTVICITTPLMILAYVLCLNFNHEFTIQPISTDFKSSLWIALIGVIAAILVLSSVAIAISTRFGQLLTITLTISIFFAGMMSDWVFGRHIEAVHSVWMERAAAAGNTTDEVSFRTVEWATGEIELVEQITEVATVPLTTYAAFSEQIDLGATWAAYAIIPNFQVMWLADALTQGRLIPGSYLVRILIYGAFYIIAALGLATILFQRREVT